MPLKGVTMSVDVDPNHRSHGNRKTTLPIDDNSKNNRNIER